MIGLFFHPEDGSSRSLTNVDKDLQHYMASYPRSCYVHNHHHKNLKLHITLSFFTISLAYVFYTIDYMV
jgi:hypothetical protein